MLLTLTLHSDDPATPATELGHLLHKHPDKCQRFDLAFGAVHVFYPEATPARCTAALLLDVDPVGLARSRSGAPENRPLWPYVNDRPYVASSFTSVAISRVLGSALGGRSERRPDLAEQALDLEATVAALAAGDAPGWVAGLFEPLGYTVSLTPPVEGIVQLTLRGRVRLSALLAHLYVLLPVVDHEKHYWVDDREVDKLLRHGAGWLATHPERAQIVRRYLKHQRGLCRDALAALDATLVDDTAPPEGTETEPETDDGAASEQRAEAPLRLDDRRRETVLSALRACGARTVVDLGCGEGKLLRALLADAAFTEIIGVDVAPTVLRRASERLKLERLPEERRARVTLLQGSAVYRDDRLRGRDAVVCVEVIEHIDPDRLDAFRDAVLGHLQARTVIVTTPNAEYNVLFREAGMRHTDHRFEWTRAEFEAWAAVAARAAGYGVRFEPVGEADPQLGPPTQMAVFTREAPHAP
jgi:3' terminal RNA ribose 2'-O-methyltransferase Hen1